MKKCHILGIFRLSCAFYYKKAHVKTSWKDTSPSRPKFNLLHQRNSPLRLVQRYGTDPGIAGIFSAILGRGPRAFLIGKISDVNPEFGKFSEYSKLIIFSKLT